ncbi:MAG TPA: hypothetical protein VEV17_06040 [Bryobacteraceae bacterium]|nr:hypothetical protein [Bryobacteraceae bacterium]
MLDVAQGFRRLLEALDRLQIQYMVGGSLANSAHGIYRSTNHIDIVARLSECDVRQLASELAGDFYADADAMLDALRRGRPFNVIHLGSSSKVDIFPASDAFTNAQVERARVEEIVLGAGEAVKCRVATPEDTILAKLMWYRAGGEQSERQWSDLRGVRSVQADRLDRAYLDAWARTLRVADLWQRLLNEGTT